MTEARHGTAEDAARRLPEWSVVAAVGAVAVVMFSIPYWLRPLFYYSGDNPESFVPVWYHLGAQLRAGHWPMMDPAGWYGGNYAAEGEYSMWNPAELLNYVVVSLFDNLAAASALVNIEFLALLAMGVYLLCREYGAARMPSVVLGLAMPAGGFTLYYAAAGWPAELMALTWLAWFWWAARRHVRGALNPFVPFVFGVLAMTTGNPYAALGMAIVIVGICVELAVRRDYRPIGHLVLTGICVAASALLAFLPLQLVLPVTNRQSLAMISNDMFLVPHLGDLLTSSAPSYLPGIVTWNGAVREMVPSTYFAWFIVPLLPWLRFSALRRAARPLTSVAVISGCYFLLVLGPSNLWLFRWPIRLVEHLYLGLSVLVAVLLSAGLAHDRPRRRALASAVLVVVAGYLSAALSPEIYRMHLLVTVLVLVLVAVAVVTYRRYGPRPFGAVLLAGTVAIMSYQTGKIPTGPNPVIAGAPISVAQVRQGASFARGTILQLADQTPVRSQDYADGDLLFGNESLLRGHESINHYSGISYEKFNAALCMTYKGEVCAEAFRALWQPVADTGVPLVDALRVQTLILQRDLLPTIADQPPPPGWQVVARDDVRTVWVRSAAPPYPGRVSWASAGTQVVSSDAQPESELVGYHAPAGGGRLLFARLNWPGYTATVDGAAVPVRETDAGLIAIDLPPGQHVLRLSFSEPGLRLGAWALGAATLVVLAQTAIWWWPRRRRRGTLSAGGSGWQEEPGEDQPAGAGRPRWTR
ncbi:glycosyltransferase family protein [Amycolatopsis alkalitolerans]|uniref:YfhO family protein n=1 Tax=Amycolatopsis alkalitolerans TaxID=2547244 RepID=A0A5C4M9P5_9PSEU|nr:YfhO family protein [Amycolatopsis alkalitolerans]TNC28639.1 YfhO family protein [Amycolatopsis alkalitolerans]